jgi:TDG/mug DNA glycosylase family protein
MSKRTNLPKPTKAEIQAAIGKTIPDVIGPDLKVLFCGYNPGLYSGAVGHHFARPGNRFWRTLHAAGYTDRVLAPFEEQTLLTLGYGLTNLVERATATANELSAQELIEGRRRFEAKVKRYQPEAVAILGLGAYRAAFKRPQAVVGRQPELIGEAIIWLLPNPSGLNAHYQVPDLAVLFRELRLTLEER